MMSLFHTIADSFLAPELTATGICLRLLFASLLGFAIGFERQHKREGTGIRTFTLITVSCCAAMCVSIWIPQTYPHMLNGDPGRIAAQIITGVGFLGAGCILRSKASVVGMTTAASVWTTAIIGMLAGAALYVPATALTLITLFILIIVSKYERKAELTGEIKILTLEFGCLDVDFDQVVGILSRHSLHIISVNSQKEYETNASSYQIKVQVSPNMRQEQFFADMHELVSLKSASLSNF